MTTREKRLRDALRLLSEAVKQDKANVPMSKRIMGLDMAIKTADITLAETQ